jgi:hypothetical protein
VNTLLLSISYQLSCSCPSVCQQYVLSPHVVSWLLGWAAADKLIEKEAAQADRGPI